MRLCGSAAIAAALALVAAGCANDGNLNTAAITKTDKSAEAKTAAIDPACQALVNQIDALRKDGTTDRLEKAAAGKDTTVSVKRTAIAKQAELNKANADYQAKCGPKIAPTQAAAVPAPIPAAAAAPAADAAKDAAKAVAPKAKAIVTKPQAAAPAPAATVAAAAAPGISKVTAVKAAPTAATADVQPVAAVPAAAPDAEAAAGMAAAKAAVQDQN